MTATAILSDLHHVYRCVASQRSDAWQATTRRAGHYPLAVYTLDRATLALNIVRPTSLVVMDAALIDGQVWPLIGHIQAIAPQAPILVIGNVTVGKREQPNAENGSRVQHVQAPVGLVVNPFLAAA